MEKIKIIFLFSSLLFSQSDNYLVEEINLEPGSTFIDLTTMNVIEKKNVLKSMKKKTNKFMFHFSRHDLMVQHIVSIEDDSLCVELLDSWWWNRPKKPLFYNISPIESVANDNEPSHKKIVLIEDIQAIQVLKNNSTSMVIFPLLLIVVFMEILSL